MKFLCDNCGTRYTIADEKVRRKVLKIRCRVCENVMTVRGPRTKPPSRMPPVITAPPDPLAPVTEPEWYAAPGNAQVGPMPVERLTDLIEDGTIKRDTLVWNDGMDDWRPANDVTVLKIHFLPPPPPPPPPMPSLDDQDTRLFEAEKDSISTVGGDLPSTSQLPAPPAPPPPPAGITDRDTQKEPPAEGAFPGDLSADFGLFDQGTGDLVDDGRETVAEPSLPGFDDFERVVPAADMMTPTERPRPQGPLMLVVVLVVIGIAGAAWHFMGDKPINAEGSDAALAAMTRRDATILPPDATPAPVDEGVAAPDAITRAKTAPRRRRTPTRARAGREVPTATPEPVADVKIPKKRFAGSLAELDEGKISVKDALREKRQEASADVVQEVELPAALSQRQIVQVIGEHKRGLNGCYDRQLNRGEAIKVGRLTLKFDIQPSGRTSNVNLGRRYEGTVLKTCIKALVKRLRFPRFRGEAVTIEYPLIFQTSL